MNYLDPEGDLNLCIPMVAHEMMTSIHITRGYGALLTSSMDELHKRVHEYHERSTGEMEHLRGLIDKLLHLYRYQARGVKLHLEMTDMGALLRKEVEPFRVQNPEVAFVVDIPGEIEAVMVDKGEVRELMRCLLENGVKYTPKGQTFFISVKQDEEQTQLVFKNTGVGIDDVEKVLNPFQREHHMQAGVGLGFVIARSVAQLHKGQFEIESDGESYTEVRVRLPRVID